MRLVESALRCYPQRWRSRHGDEAAEVAVLLIRDGTPAWSVACSYLMGAARTRLVIEPRRRLGAAVGALLLAAGSLGVPLALLSTPAPANAASVAHSRPGHPRPAHRRPAGLRPADLRPADLRPADLRPADLRHGGSRPSGARPADPRDGGGRGAPDRCDRHDHC
jgi:hypothetical protein